LTFGSGGPSNLIPSLFPRRIGSEVDPFDAESTLAELYQNLGGSGSLRYRDAESYFELESLRRESRADLFFENVLNLAARMESAQLSEPAAEVYVFLSQNPHVGIALRERAQTQLRALVGSGDPWARTEHLGRHLVAEALDPANLVAMGAAGVAFRGLRFVTLSRLATAGTETFFTRGLGARLLAGTAGFLAEVPTFTLSHHGAAAALGQEVDWSGAALRRDMASGALLLLSLRGMGALSQTALGRFASGQSAGASALRFFLPQTAMLGGLLLTRRLEEQFGLRQRIDGATAVADALATLLQFHVGGRLSQQVFGEGLALQERRMEGQTAVLELLNSPSAATRVRRPWSARSPSSLTAMGLGLLTLLQPGLALAQDGHSLGGMPILDPVSWGVLGLAGTAIAYGIKRAHDYLRGNPAPSPEYFSKHRDRLIAGLGGKAPTNDALPGEENLIQDRLLHSRGEPLYRQVAYSQLLAVLLGTESQGKGGVFRDSGFSLPPSVGPRVFEIGIHQETGEVTQILELTEALPQTPAPVGAGQETFFRVAQLTDLQQYSDAQQCPVLALPINEHSDYFLGIPLSYQSGAGYHSPIFQNGFRAIDSSNYSGLGGLGGLLDRAMAQQAPRSFLIDNDGQGYLILDQEASRVEVVPRNWQETIQREGARVNGQPLSGDHPGAPLHSGDQIQTGDLQMRFLAPRPAFRLAMARFIPAPPPTLPVDPNEEVPRFQRLLQDLRMRSWDFARSNQLIELMIPARLRLPDMVLDLNNGDRIVLSPRLHDGSPVPVGANPGLDGIYLHGAWHANSARYSIPAQAIEFFLRQEELDFFVSKASRLSTLRLLRNGAEIPLPEGEEVALQDYDILEFGPASRRTQFRWFRDLDAMERGR